MSRDLYSLVASLNAVLVLMVVYSNGSYDFSSGRVVILNHKLLEWPEAVLECEQKNGTLLTVADVSTMYDTGLNGRWIVWVGLRLDGDKTSMTWESGLPVTWTNWNTPPQADQCVSLETSVPFGWRSKNCSTKLPSLCEIKSETPCYFERFQKSSIIGFTNSYFIDVDLASCKNACLIATDFRCLSIEYNHMRNICQLSERNRWTNPSQFTNSDREWDYYHLDCFENEVNLSLVWPSTVVTESTTLPTTATTEQFCFSLEQLQPSENATKQIEMVIKELQELQIRYKNRRRAMTKESTPDHRPSATYMGGAAIVIVSVLLGVVVVLDALTLSRHCCNKVEKRKHKKYRDLSNEIVRQAGQSVLAERQLALSVQHLVVDFSKSKMLNGTTLDDKENRENSNSSISKHVTKKFSNGRISNGVPHSNHTGGSSSSSGGGRSSSRSSCSSRSRFRNSVIDSNWILDENFEHNIRSIDTEDRCPKIDQDLSNACNTTFQNEQVADNKVNTNIENTAMESRLHRRYHRSYSDYFVPYDRNHRMSHHRSWRKEHYPSHTNRTHSSSWHNTSMAGSAYTLTPFMGRARSRNHAPAWNTSWDDDNHVMETSFKQFDDG